MNTEGQLKLELAAAKDEVRDLENRFANLSHSLKGSVAGIQAALRNTINSGQLDKYSRCRIQRALRDLNLMKNQAFAVNHSYSGSREDFIYDLHNPSKDAFGFQQLILRSLYSGLSNIFDGTNFGKFQAGYFPRNGESEAWIKLLTQSKNELQELDENSIDDFVNYSGKYFFNLQVSLNGVDDYRIGNSKSSGMKMLALFQEIILNAIKYTAFRSREQRFIHIALNNSDDNIILSVKNSMNPTKREKSSGMGHIVINNIAKIIDAEPTVIKSIKDKIYEVKILFKV